MIGTGEPWVVLDRTVVARSSGLISPTAAIQSARWSPALDYRYSVDGERAPFATECRIQFSPDVPADGASVRLELMAIEK